MGRALGTLVGGKRYRCQVRMRLFVLAAVFLPALSMADREIFIPTGDKLPLDTMRLEYMLMDPNTHAYDAFAAFGLTRELEAEFELQNLGSGNPGLGTFNLGYTFVNPVTDTVPGISVGVQDALNNTDRGRSFYIATTYRVGTTGEMGADHLDVNFGIGFGHRTRPYVGVVLPFSPRLVGLVEDDGENLTGGIEIRPFHGVQLRWMAQEHLTFWSLRWTARF